MQKVAQSWLVLTIAGSSSAFFLGLDAFLGELPILLFTLVGGVVADRPDRRHGILGSPRVQMATAFTLAGLRCWDAVRVAYILLLSFIAGLGQAFGGPAYQSLIPSLIPKETLPNAVALNSASFNTARLTGPAIAGVLIAWVGTGPVFLLNAASFAAVIISLFRILDGWELINTILGLTLTYLQDILRARAPKSLRTACLLSKPSRRLVDVKVEYIGFTIEDKFVVGYGLDHAGQFRHLPFIGVQE